MGQQAEPRNFFSRFPRIAADIGELTRCKPRMLLRLAKEAQPKDQPDETDSARGDKRPRPAPAQVNPRDGERCDDRADIRSGIEDAGGQRALLSWKPFGDDLDARGKV